MIPRTLTVSGVRDGEATHCGRKLEKRVNLRF